MSYINREQVLKDISVAVSRSALGETSVPYLDWKTVVSFIVDAPAATVVDVKYGTWLLETDEEEPNPMFKLVVCSACNKKSNNTYKFCPNCGAKMSKET